MIIVIKSKVMERISGPFYVEWRAVSGSRNDQGKLTVLSHLIPKKRALSLIKKKNLVLSYTSRDGEVYDTPTGDFKALFPEGLTVKSEIEQIEKIDKA